MKRLALALILTIIPIIAVAQKEKEATTATTTSTAAQTTTLIRDDDSRDTKAQLHELLNRMPPEIGKVLKLDPTLWSNQTFMNNYPALAQFVAAHPDVAHSPAFYLDSIWIPSDAPLETAQTRVWREMVESAMAVSITLAVIAALTWLIRTFVEQRRWTHLSRVQTEVHNKLLDRFSSNEELLAYIQTAAGRRFLESAPIPLHSPKSIAAPIDRILWSVQIGLIVAAGGLGLKFVSWNIADKDAIEPLAALGAIAIAIGLGFVVSAAASYFLSRKFGLWSPPADAVTAETID